MIFHGYFRSSAAWRCRIAFNLKGVQPDETTYVHLRKGEQRDPGYLARNPQGLVPTLELDDGNAFTQSMAIVEWLEETHPEPALLPADPAARARVRAFAQIIACDIHPLQNLRVLNYLRHEYGQDQDGVETWCRRWLGDGLAACNALVTRDDDSRFCFANTPGLADVFLVPQMGAADRFGVDTTTMPRLRAIAEACAKLPAFAEAAPSRQPDVDA